MRPMPLRTQRRPFFGFSYQLPARHLLLGHGQCEAEMNPLAALQFTIIGSKSWSFAALGIIASK
jgi:hypothetical protein